MLNHIITEPIRKHLSGQGGDRDARGLALEDVPEVLKVGVAAADGGLFEGVAGGVGAGLSGGSFFEGRDVGSADDFVVGVHLTADAVGLGVADLDLKGILGHAIELVKALRARGLNRSLHVECV